MSTTTPTHAPTTSTAAPLLVLLALPPGALACLSCGQVVPTAEQRERITTAAQSREGDPPSDPANPRALIETTFARCRTCADRDEAAGRILRDLPGLAARLGTESARHRLACALDALAAAGLPYPSTFTTEEVSALLRHLTALGGSVRWSARFAPVLRSGVRRDSATASPWDHVRAEQRDEVRRAHAHVLAARVGRGAPPLRIAPPTGRACLLCGLGHVPVTAARVGALGGRDGAVMAVWSQARTVSASVLGGRRSPDGLTGHLCPECSDAVGTVGAMGQTAMGRAYSAYLRRMGQTREVDALRTVDEVRLIGWAAFDDAEQRAGRAALAPNAEPWAHVTFTIPGDDEARR